MAPQDRPQRKADDTTHLSSPTLAEGAGLQAAPDLIASDGTPAVAKRRSALGPLWLQVLVAIVLGIGIGTLFPDAGVALKPLGDA
ncbi:MAG: hypothetical protein ACRYG8_30010, partial [Janthinobacterium lividum]